MLCLIAAGDLSFLPDTVSTDTKLILLRMDVKDKETFRALTPDQWSRLDGQIHAGQVVQLRTVHEKLCKEYSLDGMYIIKVTFEEAFPGSLARLLISV